MAQIPRLFGWIRRLFSRRRRTHIRVPSVEGSLGWPRDPVEPDRKENPQ